MRHARLLLPALLALATAACASQKPAYYVTDAATGQRIVTAQQGTSGNQRGLLSSGAYAYAAPQSGAKSRGRGLFNSDVFDSDLFSSRSYAPVYSYQPQPQAYSYQPPLQQAYPQQSSVMQYSPPPQAYAQQPYQQPPPRPAGYYAERYRWY